MITVTIQDNVSIENFPFKNQTAERMITMMILIGHYKS